MISVAPYGWALNLDGNVTVDGLSASVDVSFKEIVEEADTIAAFEGRIEARKGKFSLLSLSDYFKATFSQDTVRDVQPISALDINIDASVSLDFELILSEVAATYEVFRHWYGGPPTSEAAFGAPRGFIALDVLGGGRYNSVDSELDVLVDITATLNPQIIPISITETGQLRGRIAADEQWVDPFVGLRLRTATASGYAFFARGDIGGFGANSNLVWQAMVGLAGPCWCSERLSWAVGYRALDTDYSTGSGANAFEFDMLIHGPVLGASYRF